MRLPTPLIDAAELPELRVEVAVTELLPEKAVVASVGAPVIP